MKFVVATLTLAGYVSAICPGFNYGIGNFQPLGNGINRWNVYDDSCNVQDGLTTDQNPCTQPSGIFSCATRPDDTVTFVGYKNTFTGLQYRCMPDPNSGVCGSDVINVCCRNDPVP